ncbi:DUF3905 domain-containing protein [Mesobacillus subterraneus]|uniref:DUF3905 domain-containing protein n=1 Tax=Mesobacillus subterraneus TaxID=285983 RepID=UPI00273FB100|nr:DUF3905 domain-containing protein [Mesobacillus subterraneus]WLR53721.1 DUF3905 domain-containing protein [Mesobacillus subterraneus]
MVKKDRELKALDIEETLPHQINAPSFKDTGIEMEAPFKNEHGVIIGDSLYASENSPLENWTDETDPAIMAGDEWVHPTNDIGWNTSENRDLLEEKRKPQSYPFMHPTKDVSKDQD